MRAISCVAYYIYKFASTLITELDVLWFYNFCLLAVGNMNFILVQTLEYLYALSLGVNHMLKLSKRIKAEVFGRVRKLFISNYNLNYGVYSA